MSRDQLPFKSSNENTKFLTPLLFALFWEKFAVGMRLASGQCAKLGSCEEAKNREHN